MDCFCTGPNWCNIAVHSTGDLHLGYALATFGGTQRDITDASPDASGNCTQVGLDTQQGWNIDGLFAAGGVSGGSELAGVAIALGQDIPLDHDLQVSVARAMYDHNNTAGHTFRRYAGSSKLPGVKAITSAMLPGEDDGAVAFHSSGAMSVVAAYCLPNATICGTQGDPTGTLNLGTQGSTVTANGPSQFVPKWANHTLIYRDINGNYDHLGLGQWAGIIGRMLPDVVAASQ